ncbi:fructosamine kinase [Nocardioides marmoriginsengisoli]|uniref:Fructosamine kinase n=1 Tax=Nocardioides marmoriginsengisoli TaxID=661483 RepID=A0A3N0CAN4_9ACTN|nr:fructosamine kinase family protein [Nocardioides marmoriginsengisoli]RNL60524.1 fructosamine kinase [Nocardioides marmoriginsengisoli]
MARMRTLAERAEHLLGAAVVSTAPVAGGDTCTSTRLRLSDGRSALIKTRPNPPAGFFEAEARGLRWLAEPGVAPVAEVLGVQEDCLVLGWVEPTKPTPEAAAEFGRMLARLHASGAEEFGAEQDGFISTLPLPNRTCPSWPEFFAVRRILPYLRLVTDRGQISPADAEAVDGVVRRIVELAGPDEPPARLHGDLWSGNLVWSADRSAVLVDPSAYGGHRETDLAMLTLFGMPQLARVLAAYAEETPLADGWEERQPLHQLFPLLVHAALFGGRYGALAGDAARKLL